MDGLVKILFLSYVNIYKNQIYLWDQRIFKIVKIYKGNFNQYSLLKFYINENQEFLFSSGQDNLIRIWELSSGKLLTTFNPFQNLNYSTNIIKTIIFNDYWNINHESSIFYPGLWLNNENTISFYSNIF